jgi:peptide-methionine (R)-S-oxide reductase
MTVDDDTSRQNTAKIVKGDAEWRSVLSPEQFRITREHGTERAYTGPHLDEKRPGTYLCVCCSAELFTSGTKFDSGSGWPSFFAPARPDVVAEQEDRSWLMRRVEITCARCDAHLGHVFPDGPRPTGLRYCVNGHALAFEPKADDPHLTSLLTRAPIRDCR